MGKITYLQAINEALRECMREDENVVLIGEDLGIYGGGFGATKGLSAEFGERRVWQTPISETAFTGAAVGAALMGLRPVVEIMFADFMTLAADPLINHAASFPFMAAGALSVPMVVRTPMGAGTGAASQHSQCPETMFLNTPGLKVLAPSTPTDAKYLLKAAVKDDSPVIFFEHKMLYKSTEIIQNAAADDIIIGKADIKRSGSDVSIITYSYDTELALAAAEALSAEGIDAEVVDLRSLRPLDTQTITASVKKTGRAVVVGEAHKFAGFGAEISAAINESDAFYSLKCPVARLGGSEMPIAYAKEIESASVPDAAAIANEVRKVMKK